MFMYARIRGPVMFRRTCKVVQDQRGQGRTAEARAVRSRRGWRGGGGGALLRCSAALLGLPVTLYLGAAVLLELRRPVLSFDALAALEKPIPRAGPEGRALELYLEALEMMPPEDDAGPKWLDAKDHVKRLEVIAESRAFVQKLAGESSETIALLRTIRLHPVLGFAPDESGGTDSVAARFFNRPQRGPDNGEPMSPLEVDFGYRTPLRRAFDILLVEAALAASEGRADDFVAAIESCFAVAGHTEECPSPVATQYARGQRWSAFNTLVSAIENHGDRLGDAHLARLDAVVRGQPDDALRALEFERNTMLDLLQRCYSDDGSGDGRMLLGRLDELAARGWVVRPTLDQILGKTGPPQKGTIGSRPLSAPVRFLLAPLSAWREPTRREAAWEIESYFASLKAASNAPTALERSRLALRADAEHMARSATMGMLFANRSLSGGVRLANSECQRRFRDAAVAAIGIERFRRANGRVPSTLAELESFVGRRLGSDFYEERPWRYALVDGRPLIYDSGDDGLVDRARTQEAERDYFDAGLGAADLPRVRRASLLGAGVGATPSAALLAVSPPTETRSSSAVPSDAPLDPTQPITDVDGAASARGGDTVWVWWRSGAAGASREIPARPKPAAPEPPGG